MFYFLLLENDAFWGTYYFAVLPTMRKIQQCKSPDLGTYFALDCKYVDSKYLLSYMYLL